MERVAQFDGFIASYRSGRLERYEIPAGMDHSDAVVLLHDALDADAATALSKSRTPHLTIRRGREGTPALAPHAAGLKLLLTPDEEAAVAQIDAAAAEAELAKRGIEPEVVQRIRDAYADEVVKARWGLV